MIKKRGSVYSAPQSFVVFVDKDCCKKMINVNLSNSYSVLSQNSNIAGTNQTPVLPMLKPGGGGDEPELLLRSSQNSDTASQPINSAEVGEIYSPSGIVKVGGSATKISVIA